MTNKEETARWRNIIAEKAGDFLKSLIAPRPKDMSNHTLIITGRFRGDRSVVEEAVAAGEHKAHTESSNSTMAKVLFGILRIMGFGRIETTGEGGVETNEVEPGLCEVKVILGVAVENYEKLIAASGNINQKLSKIPARVIYKMLGVDPSKLTLVSIHLQVGHALPWTEQSDEGDIREG